MAHSRLGVLTENRNNWDKHMQYNSDTVVYLVDLISDRRTLTFLSPICSLPSLRGCLFLQFILAIVDYRDSQIHPSTKTNRTGTTLSFRTTHCPPLLDLLFRNPHCAPDQEHELLHLRDFSVTILSCSWNVTCPKEVQETADNTFSIT